MQISSITFTAEQVKYGYSLTYCIMHPLKSQDVPQFGNPWIIDYILTNEVWSCK